MDAFSTSGVEGARALRPVTVLLPILVGLLALVRPAALAAQCPPAATTYPNGVIEGPVSDGADGGRLSSVAIDADNRFVVAFETPPVEVQSFTFDNDVLVQRFDADGECICLSGDECPALLTEPPLPYSLHGHVSVSMRRVPQVNEPDFYVAWIGSYQRITINWPNRLLALTQPFDEQPFTPFKLAPGNVEGKEDATPSSAVSLVSTGVGWANRNGFLDERGLILDTSVSPAGVERVRCCLDDDCTVDRCFTSKWRPCVAMDSPGYVAYGWADAEEPTFENSATNIALRIYDPDGATLLASREGGPNGWVNDPNSEPADTLQSSPAVALSDDGSLVVTWVGPRPSGCTTGGLSRIYARRYQWTPGSPPSLQTVSDPFVVNNDSAWEGLIDSDANPTVSFSTELQHLGRFAIVWNSFNPFVNRTEVRAQYFHADGQPRGRELAVTQLAEPDPPEHTISRRVAESAQHTCQYRSDDSMVISWTATDSLGTTDQVYFTILPPNFADTSCSQIACLKGDCDNNTLVDGRDIQPFVHALLNGVSDPDLCTFEIFVNPELLCPYDCNCDCQLTTADIPRFVTNLLGVTSGCPPMPFTAGADCNQNGIDDISDIYSGTSPDCNRNFIPDSCDIASDHSPDVDADGIPDECEPDCNGNDVPDDRDIQLGTSLDINDNNVPDECDPDCDDDGQPNDYEIAVNGAPDCNANGIPDSCEQDCNENGVPDDCDVDPTDPDGDLWVSEDCNGNEWPDECDIAAGPFFGSADTDENGIPDECEESFMGGGGGQAPSAPGGGGGEGGQPMTPEELDAAWEDFFEWYNAQTWGPASEFTGLQQYQRYLDKLAELGLSLPLFP